MNLGQYVTDLISKANDLQKLSAKTDDPVKIYELATEIKDVAKALQTHVVKEYWKNA